ncbi:MAG: FHA domain-containing protein [Oligoflexia bacterium]|nr:FHA domain-containing protein [Oligoflexia bacterium]
MSKEVPPPFERKIFLWDSIEKKRIEISDGVIIGRGGQANIIINNNDISSKHLQLFVEGDAVLAVDLGSTNGTFINGRKIMPNQMESLQTGDKISLGGMVLYFNKEVVDLEIGESTGTTEIVVDHKKEGKRLHVGRKRDENKLDKIEREATLLTKKSHEVEFDIGNEFSNDSSNESRREEASSVDPGMIRTAEFKGELDKIQASLNETIVRKEAIENGFRQLANLYGQQKSLQEEFTKFSAKDIVEKNIFESYQKELKKIDGDLQSLQERRAFILEKLDPYVKLQRCTTKLHETNEQINLINSNKEKLDKISAEIYKLKKEYLVAKKNYEDELRLEADAKAKAEARKKEKLKEEIGRLEKELKKIDKGDK